MFRRYLALRAFNCSGAAAASCILRRLDAALPLRFKPGLAYSTLPIFCTTSAIFLASVFR